jgi:hypothetical protein
VLLVERLEFAAVVVLIGLDVGGAGATDQREEERGAAPAATQQASGARPLTFWASAI